MGSLFCAKYLFSPDRYFIAFVFIEIYTHGKISPFKQKRGLQNEYTLFLTDQRLVRHVRYVIFLSWLLYVLPSVVFSFFCRCCCVHEMENTNQFAEVCWKKFPVLFETSFIYSYLFFFSV